MTSIDELQKGVNRITNPGTLAGYTTILNKINRELGLEANIIHHDSYNSNPEAVAQAISKIWKISTVDGIKQKMGALSSLVTRAIGDGHDLGKYRRSLGGKNLDSLELESYEKNESQEKIPDWKTLQKKLAEAAGMTTRYEVGKIIALIFSYGYVLRVSEIFTTRLVDDGILNYLDLEKCKWTIRKQKNGKEKTFSVDEELCGRLRDTVREGTDYLLHRKDGSPYKRSSMILSLHKWGDLPDNTTIRKSFETWNFANNTEEVRKRWNEILGHSERVADDFYNKPERLERVESPPPSQSRVKSLPLKRLSATEKIQINAAIDKVLKEIKDIRMTKEDAYWSFKEKVEAETGLGLSEIRLSKYILEKGVQRQGKYYIFRDDI